MLAPNEKPFTTGEIAEDIGCWIRRIDALGEVLTGLGFQALEKQSPDTLIMTAEQLGMTIRDYAKAIEYHLDGAYLVLRDYFNQKESALTGRPSGARAQTKDLIDPDTKEPSQNTT